MLRLSFVVVAMFFCTAQAKDDRETSAVDEKSAEDYGNSLKDKVAPETIERMNTLIQANNAKDCWEFAVVKTKDKMDGAICFFEQYPKLVACALPHAQALISKTNSFVEANAVWVIAVGIVAAIDRDYKLINKVLNWVKVRTAQVIKTNPELPRIKKEFKQAIQEKNAKAAEVLVTECVEIGFGKPCSEMKARMEKETAKWERDEEAQGLDDEEKQKKFDQAINKFMYPRARVAAKQIVLQNARVPSSVKWINVTALVQHGPVFGFHLTFDVRDEHGESERLYACVALYYVFTNNYKNFNPHYWLQTNERCPRDPLDAKLTIIRMLRNGLKEIAAQRSLGDNE
jgi:hypothetical protein